MNYCKYIIEYIKKIKEDLDNNIYCSKEDLEKDFNKINKLTGIKTNDMGYEDLNNIFTVNEFIINEICKIS